MNYEVTIMNYVECGILPTEDEANNENIFDSFGKAKKKYLQDLRCQRDQWNIEIRIGLKLTKSETDKHYQNNHYD